MTNRYLFYTNAGLIRTGENAPTSDVNVAIKKGNNNVDAYFISFNTYDRTNYYATYIATLPDGTNLPEGVMLPVEFEKDGITYEGFKIVLTNLYTNIAGIETITFSVKSLADDTQVCSAQLVFEIIEEEEEEQEDEENEPLTEEEQETLLTAMNNAFAGNSHAPVNRYLFFNSAGLIRTDEDAPESDTSVTISKGNNNVDYFYINIQENDYRSAYATVSATLPDGTETPSIILSSTDFTKDGISYKGYKFTITNAYTNLAGIETFTFRFKSLTTDSLIATSQLIITISDNDTPSDTSITPEELEELYETIQENYNTLDTKIDDVEEEIDTKLDKDFSQIPEDTSISGNETLVMNDDNGDLKKIKSELLVNKVETVNYIEPDSNKNITLVASNITTTDNSTVQNKVNEAVYFEEEEIASLDDENLLYNTITEDVGGGSGTTLTLLKPINNLDTLMFIFENNTIFATVKENYDYSETFFVGVYQQQISMLKLSFTKLINNQITISCTNAGGSPTIIGKLIKILRVSKRSDN